MKPASFGVPLVFLCCSLGLHLYTFNLPDVGTFAPTIYLRHSVAVQVKDIPKCATRKPFPWLVRRTHGITAVLAKKEYLMSLIGYPIGDRQYVAHAGAVVAVVLIRTPET